MVMELVQQEGMIHLVKGLGKVHYHYVSLLSHLHAGRQLVQEFKQLGLA